MAKWIGKLGGGLLGYIAGGPIWAAIGVLLGHQYDRGLTGFAREHERGSGMSGSRPSSAARQRAFFEATFRVMGHLAKADGRVSEAEIQAAREIMHRLRLHPEAVRRAIELFTEGKQPGFSLAAQLAAFRRACGRDPALLRDFLEFQMDLVLAKGGIAPSERELLWRIADQLGISRAELAQIEAVLRARRSFGGRRRRAADGGDALAAAYRALGIEAGASDREVKTAYRRLMNQHHPDKLVSRGLPDSMLDAAKERTREIRAAYELIKERRGLK
ncbi:MAG: co-chaperone DjlA [Gammaproteobacteria bacterium]|nr:MAG: co-chaperone DjlA [Gammaproteobacteria bacterium]